MIFLLSSQQKLLNYSVGGVVLLEQAFDLSKAPLTISEAAHENEPRLTA